MKSRNVDFVTVHDASDSASVHCRVTPKASYAGDDFLFDTGSRLSYPRRIGYKCPTHGYGGRIGIAQRFLSTSWRQQPPGGDYRYADALMDCTRCSRNDGALANSA